MKIFEIFIKTITLLFTVAKLDVKMSLYAANETDITLKMEKLSSHLLLLVLIVSSLNGSKGKSFLLFYNFDILKGRCLLFAFKLKVKLKF